MYTEVITTQNTPQLAVAVQQLEKQVYIPWRGKNTLKVATSVQNVINQQVLPQWLQEYEKTTNADVVLIVLEPHHVAIDDLVELIQPLLQNDYYFTYKRSIKAYGYIHHMKSVLDVKDLFYKYKQFFQPKEDEINARGLFNPNTTKIFL